MKTLIEKSIFPTGFGMLDSPSIFTDPRLKKSMSYINITTKPGETLPVMFAYTEGSETKSSHISFTYPSGKTEEEIKTMIIDAINNSLNS